MTIFDLYCTQIHYYLIYFMINNYLENYVCCFTTPEFYATKRIDLIGPESLKVLQICLTHIHIPQWSVCLNFMEYMGVIYGSKILLNC